MSIDKKLLSETDKLAHCSGKTVAQQIAVRIRVTVSFASDLVVNLPVIVRTPGLIDVPAKAKKVRAPIAIQEPKHNSIKDDEEGK